MAVNLFIFNFKNHIMLKLFYKILLLFLAFILVDFLLGLVLDKAIDNSPDGRYYKAQYTIEKSKEDVVIFGSSSAERHYVPSIIEDSLKTTCWNAGRGNQNLPFWISMAEGVLNRYTPKLVILDIEPDYLSWSLSESYEPSAGMLRPFYKEHEEIRPMVNEVSKFEKYFIYSQLYAYNSSYYYLLRPYLVKGLDGKIEDKGWKSLIGHMSPTDASLNIVNSKNSLNEKTVKLFDKFITGFTEKGCPVFISISPNYKRIINNTSTLDYIRKMDNVFLVEYEDHATFINDHNNFKDEGHLNKEAAIKFTSMLTEKMKKMNAKSILNH